MWAMLTDIAQQVDWHGQKLTPEDWKDICTAALRKCRVVPGIDGGFVPLGMRTSDMSKGEMSSLLELIAAFGAQHNVKFGDGDEESLDAWAVGVDGERPAQSAPHSPSPLEEQMRNDPNDDRNEETYRNIIKDRNLELDRTYAERNEYYNEMQRLRARVIALKDANSILRATIDEKNAALRKIAEGNWHYGKDAAHVMVSIARAALALATGGTK